MSVSHNASRRKLNGGTLLAACLGVTFAVVWSGAATAQTTINWNGSTSTDYNDGANWDGGIVPNGTTNIATVGASANNPVFNGGPDVRRLNINYGGVFTMQSGNYLVSQGAGDTRLSLGANATTGVATLTVTGGTMQIDGSFRTTDERSGNNSVSVYNQSGGRVFVNGTVDNNPVQWSTGGSNVGYRTLFNITGGTTVSSAAITMGQSASSGNAAFATGTISGGVLMATRYFAAALPNDITQDERGTLRFQGGGFKFSGGQMIGSDVSARDGFRQGTTHTQFIAPLIASGTVGIEYAGGMTQIYTDRDEGTIYYVQTSALQGAPTDPVPAEAVTSAAMNRGFKRGLVDVGPNTGAAWTSLANTTIKANLLSGVSPARPDGLVTNVATIAAFDVADYNTDGVVDQGDYVSWYGANGLTYSGGAPVDIQTVLNNDLPMFGADGNGDSKVDDADFTVWQGRVGQRRTDGAMQFAKDQAIDVASGSVSQSDPGYTVSSNVDNMNLTSFNALNTKAFTKTGAGELVLTRANNLTYGATIAAGTLRLSGSQASATSWSGTTTVQAGATLQVDAGATVVSKSINVAGGTLTVAPGGNLSVTVTSATDTSVSQTFGSGVSVSNNGSVNLSNTVPQTVNVSSLSVDVATGGRLDVGRGTVNVAGGLNATELVSALVAGRNGGDWNGASGIASPAAGLDPSTRAVGWIDNGDGSYEVSYAAAGDWNVNGEVDFDDVILFVGSGLFDTGLPATWSQGDFDYNGVVDIDDVLAQSAAGLFNAGPYNVAPPPMAPLSGGINAVPEPATWVLVAVGAACVAGRSLRRRTSQRA